MVESLREIEAKALQLPERSRAELAKSLLASLEGAASEAPLEEVIQAWLGEAERRAEELAAGQVEAIPHEQVMNEARARLR